MRRVAAASLVKLNAAALFNRLIEPVTSDNSSSRTTLALAEVRAAADANAEACVYDQAFGSLPRHLRRAVYVRSWALRLKRGFAMLFVLLFPATILSCMAAGAFKSLPAAFNYALCQADAGVAMGVFHGVTAAVIWGAGITLALAVYYITFAKTSRPRGLLKPLAALGVGALAGFIGSALLLLVICTVFGSQTLVTMAWVRPPNDSVREGVLRALLFDTRFAWPYLLQGAFLGVGMAAMTNALRASQRWNSFLDRESALSSVGETFRLLRNVTRLALPFAWPIACSVTVAGLIAFAVLRSAPDSISWSESPGHALTAGLTKSPEKLRNWKRSPWGEALGIIGDGATQVVGGFFAIVGLGVGIVTVRHGINVEPRKN